MRPRAPARVCPRSLLHRRAEQTRPLSCTDARAGFARTQLEGTRTMADNSKNILKSRTIWGILIAVAGVIADSGGALASLFGVSWADKAVIAAGLFLAFAGRLAASKTLTLNMIAWLLVPVLLIGNVGCATSGADSSSSYRAAKTLYQGSVEIATTQAMVGNISRDQALEFEHYRKHARDLLDEWGAMEVIGRPFDSTALDALLLRMIQLQENDHGTRPDTRAYPRHNPARDDGDQSARRSAFLGQTHRGGVPPVQGFAGRDGRRMARAA